ncbi:MAG: ArnT family glycosyltransferase [Bosea sp. (in: a-proteobacteria)]
MISSVANAVFDWVAAARWRAGLLLVLISLGAFLPGFTTLQPMDRDEPRFAQASKQMLETRDFVDIRFQDEARHKKPVGIYWLQSIAVAMGDLVGVDNARTQIWLYRIPSLIGAMGAALLTWWALLAFLPARLAILGGALMASSILLGVEARLAKTDAVLAACAIAAMGALLRVWLDWIRALPFALSPRNWLVFWGAVALSILVKGPILLMVVAFPMLMLSWREGGFGWLKPLRWKQGLMLAGLVVLPWLLAIAWKTGGSFFAESVGKDMLGKVAEGQEKHGAPPGFYVFAFFGTFWPAAPVAAMAGWFAWKNWRDPLVAFLLAWILPSWLIFEAVPTKLPHYVLPLYAAVAGLALLAVARGGIDMGRRGAFAVAALIAIIPAVVMVGLPIANWSLDRTLPFIAMPLLLVGVALALWAMRALWAGAFEAGLWRGVMASLVVSLGVFGFANTSMRALKLSPRLAEAVASTACRNPQVITAGYREPSLVFLVGTELDMGDGAEAARFLNQPGCRIAFVTQREQPGFEAEASKIGLAPRLVTRISGFNINGGRRLDISVLAGGS